MSIQFISAPKSMKTTKLNYLSLDNTDMFHNAKLTLKNWEIGYQDYGQIHFFNCFILFSNPKIENEIIIKRSYSISQVGGLAKLIEAKLKDSKAKFTKPHIKPKDTLTRKTLMENMWIYVLAGMKPMIILTTFLSVSMTTILMIVEVGGNSFLTF